jgi:hypothetical protein
MPKKRQKRKAQNQKRKKTAPKRRKRMVERPTLADQAAAVAKAKANPRLLETPSQAAGTGRRRKKRGVEIVPLMRKRVPRRMSSGDLQALSPYETVDVESVHDLVDEGQGFEAGFVEGVEDAPTPDKAELPRRKVPEGFVPHSFEEKNKI